MVHAILFKSTVKFSVEISKKKTHTFQVYLLLISKYINLMSLNPPTSSSLQKPHHTVFIFLFTRYLSWRMSVRAYKKTLGLCQIGSLDLIYFPTSRTILLLSALIPYKMVFHLLVYVVVGLRELGHWSMRFFVFFLVCTVLLDYLAQKVQNISWNSFSQKYILLKWYKPTFEITLLFPILEHCVLEGNNLVSIENIINYTN